MKKQVTPCPNCGATSGWREQVVLSVVRTTTFDEVGKITLCDDDTPDATTALKPKLCVECGADIARCVEGA